MKRKRQFKKELLDKDQLLVDQLVELLHRLGMEVRFERGDFRGGLCTLQGNRKLVVINKNQSLPKQQQILIEVMRSQDLDQIYIPPNLRKFFENSVQSLEDFS